MNAHHHLPRLGWPVLLGIALLLGTGGIALAAIVTNVANTKHNLSASGPGPAKATSESEICVFCHTPHNVNMIAVPPLWNRELSTLTYTTYTSASMEAVTKQPGGTSKLCLSCHDGTLAIGTVGVLNSVSPVSIMMTGTNEGTIPQGAGEFTGYTRDIGVDLSNDHPVSFTYDAALANYDGELRSPPVASGGTPVVANRAAGVTPRPLFPLDNNEMQCTSCHDPHTWESDPSKGNHKFLRGNRLQQAQPVGSAFNQYNDTICLACHDKGGALWAYSAHANQFAAEETYLETAAAERDFPANTPVWKASCLNCHDTHTVQGATRLLREGTDSITTPKSGGNPASEETCYQCHSAFGTSIINQLASVPDIKSDFELPIHVPISRQPETHNIGGSFDDSLDGGTAASCNTFGSRCGKDFMESQAVLGKVSAGGTLDNRHAECTDCHNPHRVTKNRLFNDDAVFPAVSGTHKHTIAAGDTVAHSNLASGSLRGTFGVEPEFLSAEFGTHPFRFTAKRGDGGSYAPTNVTSTYVTREYQVCFKCHSNYAYDETDPTSLPLGYSGGTLTGTNGLLYYADNAMEFQAPAAHKGSPASTSDSGASYSANNHRSWHPVMDNTGRTSVLPGSGSPNLWRTPWNGSDADGPVAATLVNAVGNQTMYCSDCHGSDTNLAEGVVPVGGEDGNSWGPHGSNGNFLLKGDWDTGAAHNVGSNTLCFRCHDQDQYADASGAPASALSSGFGGSGTDAINCGSQPINNLHQRHAFYTTQGGTACAPLWPASENGTYRCTMCHTGTAHGWKNKAFLVNLYDLGPEITALGGETTPGSIILSSGQSVPKGTVAPAVTVPAGYSNGPYYRRALLGVVNFKPSGSWVKTDCAGGCH